MRIEQHCERTKEAFGEEYREIQEYLERHFDLHEFLRWEMMTSGDWYDGKRFDPYSHRMEEHHAEGIELIIKHFENTYEPEIVRKVCELHIRDDYSGIIPSKADFSNPEFIKKYHRDN